ncbi:MAG: cyclic nucleotide-binding domain-containing protein [Halobacteriovoraceae bacterium]|nr:cyclic nucleotide-binding domain-containing protein [Halobacteriovoraceae bacterium]
MEDVALKSSAMSEIVNKRELIEKLMSELQDIGQTLEFPDKHQLLKIGDTNEHLYFLLEGKLNINIGSETVNTLIERGDIVGEMSVISKQTCKADVVVDGYAKILKLSVDQVFKTAQLQLLIYRIFCLTLSDKLETTNVKAKNFEALNKSLENEIKKRTNDLISKNSELSLGYKKLELMHQDYLRVLITLESLEENFITNSIKILEQGNNAEQVKKNLVNAQLQLKSFTNLKVEQQLFEEQEVIVVDTDNKRRSMIKMALGGTGVKTHVAKNLDEAKIALKEFQSCTVFLSADMLEVANFISKEKIDCKIVLITLDNSADYIPKLKGIPNLSNIISLKEEDRLFSVKSITTTIRKMVTTDIFGLEKYLNWGIEVKEFEINSSDKRTELNEQVISELKKIGIRGGLATQCQLVIEELLMNAIYDAPVDEKGKSLFNHLERTEKVLLPNNEKAKLRYASDGLYLAISVEDPYGAFKRDTIYTYLENNYRNINGDFNERKGKGGAGKGLYMITESSDLVVVNVAPNDRTEVIALFDLSPKKDKGSKSLHYFEY